MKIKLIDYKVTDLTLRTSETGTQIDTAKNDLNFEVGQFFPDEEQHIFGIGFKVAFEREGVSIQTEMRFFFETDETITDDFKNGPFPAINAPAIAFPYLRSFLSILTMQAGYPPIMLPSVNFVEFAKNSIKSRA